MAESNMTIDRVFADTHFELDEEWIDTDSSSYVTIFYHFNDSDGETPCAHCITFTFDEVCAFPPAGVSVTDTASILPYARFGEGSCDVDETGTIDDCDLSKEVPVTPAIQKHFAKQIAIWADRDTECMSTCTQESLDLNKEGAEEWIEALDATGFDLYIGDQRPARHYIPKLKLRARQMNRQPEKLVVWQDVDDWGMSPKAAADRAKQVCSQYDLECHGSYGPRYVFPANRTPGWLADTKGQ